MVRLVLISLVVSLVFRSALGAGERLTPERLWELGRIGGTCVNHQGTAVAYAVRRFDLEKNTGTSEIHLLDLTTLDQRRLIADWRSVDSPQFVTTSQGERLFFVGQPPEAIEQDAKPQVWSVGLSDAVPIQVTRLEEGVANLKASPLGTHLVFTVRVKMDSAVNELFEDLPKANARIIDGLMYRHWSEWHDDAFSHLHVAELKEDGLAGEAIDLMRGLRATVRCRHLAERSSSPGPRTGGNWRIPPSWSTIRLSPPIAASIWLAWTARAQRGASPRAWMGTIPIQLTHPTATSSHFTRWNGPVSSPTGIGSCCSTAPVRRSEN